MMRASVATATAAFLCQHAYGRAPNPSFTLSDECFEPYPNLMNCMTDTIMENGTRVVETNSIPPYDFEPYCPFGVGAGYCFDPPGSFNCSWGAMVCPQQVFNKPHCHAPATRHSADRNVS